MTHLADGKPKGHQECIKHHREVLNDRLQTPMASGGVSIVRNGGKGWRTHLAPIPPLKSLIILSRTLQWNPPIDMESLLGLG